MWPATIRRRARDGKSRFVDRARRCEEKGYPPRIYRPFCVGHRSAVAAIKHTSSGSRAERADVDLDPPRGRADNALSYA